MWGPALLSGHSAWFDLTRMVEFDAALRHGEPLPAWSPDFYFGYGSPLFQFYAPLCYYLTEIPVLAGCDFPTALKVTQLLALFVSGLAMYRLAVSHFSGWAACLGGVLYMIAPYRLVDVYVRHALAEHCAFVWLPLIVWGTDRFLSHRSRAGLATATTATAGLIFTHNIMALIGLPVCVAAGWALSAACRGAGHGERSPRLPRPADPEAATDSAFARPPQEPRRSLHFPDGLVSFAAAGVPALLGVGLAAFFWWPAMSGRPFTQAEQSLTGGYFDFHRHFVDAARFFSLEWGFGESGSEAKDRMSLQIGLPHLLAGLGALALLTRWRVEGTEGRRRIQWCLVGLLIMLGAAFLCSQWSQPLWEHLPLIKYVQFPWRFLGVLVFGAAICGTALADRLGAMGGNARAPQAVLLAGLSVALAAYYPCYSHARFIAGDARTQIVGPMSGEKVDALDGVKLLIPIGRAITRAEIRAVGERATSSDDFLPRGVPHKPTRPASEVFLSPGNQVGPVTQSRLNEYRADLEMRSTGVVQLEQFWFPGWQAAIDGVPAATTPTGPQAVVSCEVPAGHHAVEFRYEAMPQRRTGWLVSLATLVLSALAILINRRSLGNIQHPTSNTQHPMGSAPNATLDA